ncbi:MAG: ATP-binding protein, partial [bacterium]|nr:ATP-binding protein [bacterium]
IPEERAEDVIYFNPGDIERPMGLNILEYDPKYPEQKTFLANETVNIFKKLWEALPEAFGPMFEQYMRNALLLIMDDPDSGSTLLEVPKVLADTKFRHYKLSKTENIVVKDFWEKEAEKAGGEAALANIVPYITSKVNVFLANDLMRPIICQQKSAFDFRKIMDEQKILLVNLSKGKLGDFNSYLLGLIIVGKFLMAAFSRGDSSEEKRPDFYLYIDEFQNFTTDTIATILAEARKYKLNLIVGHQFIGQLKENIRDAVFGNVGSMAIFRVGADDAEFVVKQFEPVFSQQDLLNIDNFNAYLKLLINNQTSLPFNIGCNPPAHSNPEIAEKIKELSRLKYGREKLVVDKEIFERSKISAQVSGAAALPENLDLR